MPEIVVIDASELVTQKQTQPKGLSLAPGLSIAPGLSLAPRTAKQISFQSELHHDDGYNELDKELLDG